MFARLAEASLTNAGRDGVLLRRGGTPAPRSATGTTHAQDPALASTRLSPFTLSAIFSLTAALAWLEVSVPMPGKVATLLILAALAFLLLEQSEPPPLAEQDSVRSDAARLDGTAARTCLTPAGLATAIVHEVNQPLSAMAAHGQACLRWFERDVPDLEAAKESVQSMLANGTRAADIIAGMTALARGSAPARDAVDLNDVVRSVLAQAQRDIEAGRVAVTMNLDDRLRPVRAGRVELDQVVLNLIANAVQALSGIDGPRELTIVSRTDRSHGEIVLEVRDNGPGFKDCALARLFEPFFTTKRTGMGMGLAICRDIVSSLGGRLDARPNDGAHGACFSVRLMPLAAGRAGT